MNCVNNKYLLIECVAALSNMAYEKKTSPLTAFAVDGRISTQYANRERISRWSVDLYRNYEVAEVHFITTTLTGKHTGDLR